ncbi:hypothetical protein [Yoonia sp. SDW83-1]|uniref:hypothetical protein n=1 Tax=Yoonia sp. SDW83-1 TaxID=3366945 RepID=UPI00398C4AC3
MSFTRNPVILLLVILSWTATASGVYLKTGGPVDPSQPGFFLALLFSVPGLLFAALVQVLNVKWLELSLLPRAVNNLKSVTTLLFGLTLAISVTFGLAFYGSVFNSFGSANRVTLDVAREAVAESVESAHANEQLVVSSLEQLYSSIRAEREEEGKTGEGPRYHTLGRALEQIEFALQRARSINVAELSASVETAPDIVALRGVGRRAHSYGAIEYQAVANSLAAAETEVLSIADNGRQMHAAMASTIAIVRGALDQDVTPVAELTDTFVSPVEWAFDVWGRLLTAPKDLDREEYLALILAIVVDLFIAMLVIYEARRGSPMANDVQVITEELAEGANRFAHVVKNVGLKDAAEAIHRIEQNSNATGKVGLFGGQVVFAEVPVGHSTFHKLMLALKAAGYASELPMAPVIARIFQREWMNFDEESRLKVFWIGRNRWYELQSFKLIALAAQALDEDMVFGEFIDWLRTEPRSRERMGRNVDVMARTVARYFPTAVGMRLSDLTPEVVDGMIEDFQQESGRTLRANTRRTYVGYFQTIIAAARGQGILPDGNAARVVKLRAA